MRGVTLVNIPAVSMETISFQQLLTMILSYRDYKLRNGVSHVAKSDAPWSAPADFYK